MTKKVLATLALCAGVVLLFSIPAFAHYGGSSLYDMGKSTTVKATVTDFVWSNPHGEISFDGPDEAVSAAWGKMIKVNWPNGKELVQD